MTEDSYVKRFEGHRYISLETYRRDGTAVRTPVWFISDKSELYIRTYEDSGKVKRIKINGIARAAPCSFEGDVLGDWADFEPSIVRGEKARLLKLFKSKYGIQVIFTSFLARLRGKRYVIIKLTPKHS